jgi:hypothetical protein
MPLPLNTQTTIGGVAVVVKSIPEKSSGVNTGPSDRPANGADLAVSAYSGAPGGSNNYSNRPRGLNIPDFSGLDKALGTLGAAIGIAEAAVGLFDTAKNLAKLFRPGSKLTTANRFELGINRIGASTLDRESVQTSSLSELDHRVRLWTDFEVFGTSSGENPYFTLLKETGGVVFPYTPNISLTYKGNYTQQEGIIHNNFPYQAYKNSSIEDITIQAEFTVQTNPEGQYWLAVMNFFKTATKMFYGKSIPVGFPPILCELSGYGTEILPNVPVVIKSFQLDLKDNVQYMEIQSLNSRKSKQFVPLSSTVTLICSPMYSRTQTREFNIQKFARGDELGYM